MGANFQNFQQKPTLDGQGNTSHKYLPTISASPNL